jgi:drug/metabolite transporter (DMT)-like permease
VLFGAMCVIWGVPYLMIRVAVRELTPATLVFARTAVAAVILLSLPAARRGLRALLPHWRALAVFAVIEITLPWLLLAHAEEHLTSSMAGLLIAGVPLVGAAVIVVTGGDERLGRRRLAGLLIGFAGVAALLGLDSGGTSTTAVVEVGGVAVCYAVGPILLAKYLSDLPSLAVIAASLAFCAIVYAPLAATELPSSVPSGRVLASVAGLAVLCTAIGFVLFFALIAEAGPVRPMVMTYVQPAVAAAVGVAILGEAFTAGMGVGFALILVGSMLATRKRRPRARRASVAAAVEP